MHQHADFNTLAVICRCCVSGIVLTNRWDVSEVVLAFLCIDEVILTLLGPLQHYKYNMGNDQWQIRKPLKSHSIHKVFVNAQWGRSLLHHAISDQFTLFTIHLYYPVIRIKSCWIILYHFSTQSVYQPQNRRRSSEDHLIYSMELHVWTVNQPSIQLLFVFSKGSWIWAAARRFLVRTGDLSRVYPISRPMSARITSSPW